MYVCMHACMYLKRKEKKDKKEKTKGIKNSL